MAITLSQIQTHFSDNWRLKNLYQKSKYAVLFPNELIQEGVAFKAKVRLPIMNDAITQKDWEPRTGFKEIYQIDEYVEVELSNNFTVYNRIAKVDKLAPNWASNKLNLTDSQKARAVDDYVLNKIGTNVSNVIPNPVKITKDNFVDELKRFQQFAESKGCSLEDTLIFTDYLTIAAMVKAKIEYSRAKIEGTSATIIDPLGFNVIEANLDKFEQQLIVVHPYAFSWIMATETPLQAGQYGHGPFFGQTFVVNNEFYEGKMVMEKFWFSYPQPKPSEVKETEQKVKEWENFVRETSNSEINQFLNSQTMVFDQLSEITPAPEKEVEFQNDIKMLMNATTLKEIYEIKKKWTDL